MQNCTLFLMQLKKNSILMFGMCDLVEKLYFWRFFALKMLITSYGEIFANREISYLDCTRRDLQFWSPE